MRQLVTRLLPAWIIIIGGLMIVPGPNGPIIHCLPCTPITNILIGIISVALGVAGLVLGSRFSDPMPGRG